jgi:ubiquitin fusion degradation protein 1
MDFNYFFGGGRGFGMGMPGPGRFENMFRCHSVAFIHRPELESGGKIILPPSALDMLTRLHIEYPMLFELSNPGLSRRMHAGVLEFVAEEGIVYMPFWMMQNLLIEEGQLITIKSTSLPRGSFVKIQPHTSTFLDISNPKAVLENSLRKFAALTKNDVICINYNNKNYYLTVLETKPADAISILETDISVDFAPPLDYKEPARTQQAATTTQTQAMAIPGAKSEKEEDDKRKFVPFGGSGARLDGKASVSPSPSTPPAFGSLLKTGTPPPATSPANKLTFGSSARPTARATKKVDSDDEEEGDDEDDEPKKKFVPFGGKGYSLK